MDWRYGREHSRKLAGFAPKGRRDPSLASPDVLCGVCLEIKQRTAHMQLGKCAKEKEHALLLKVLSEPFKKRMQMDLGCGRADL